MKKAIIPAVLIAAVVGGVLSMGRGQVPKNLSVGDWRVAIALKSCLEDAGITVDKLNTHCLNWKVTGNFVACITDREQIHDCEIPVDALPDAAFRKVAVCQWTDDEGRTVRGLKFAELSATLPPGYTCVLIHSKLPALWLMSMRGAKSFLLEAIKAKCCAECSGTCFVHSGAWGQCPYCLLDDNCADYCPPPLETP